MLHERGGEKLHFELILLQMLSRTCCRMTSQPRGVSSPWRYWKSCGVRASSQWDKYRRKTVELPTASWWEPHFLWLKRSTSTCFNVRTGIYLWYVLNLNIGQFWEFPTHLMSYDIFRLLLSQRVSTEFSEHAFKIQAKAETSQTDLKFQSKFKTEPSYIVKLIC